MKKIVSVNTILWLIMFVVLHACFKDDSSLGVLPISEITIASSTDSIYSNFGDELKFNVTVEQTDNSQELLYEWRYGKYDENSSDRVPVEDSLYYLSNDSELKHTFKDIGAFILRLKVENNDHAVFKYFTLFIDTPYQEGLTVLSENKDGKNMVSFKKTATPLEVAQGIDPEFIPGLFEYINPGYTMKDGIGMVLMDNHICFATEDEGKMYVLNRNTFDLLNFARATDPEFEPKSIVKYSEDIAYFTSNTGIPYGYNNPAIDIYRTYALPSNLLYKQFHVGNTYYGSSKPYPRLYAVTKEGSKVVTSSGGNVSDTEELIPEGYEVTNIVSTDNNQNLYAIAREPENPGQVHVMKFFKLLFILYNDYSYTTSQMTLPEDEEIIISDKYKAGYYVNGAGLYKWMFSTSSPNLPEEASIELTNGKEFTTIAFSPDKEFIYAGVYDESATELGGSVYIYSTKDLTLINKYEGIAYKPIQIFYKAR